MVSNSTIFWLLPELVLVLLATLVYVGGAFWPTARGWSWLAGAGIFVACCLLYNQAMSPDVGEKVFTEEAHGIISGPIAVDQLSITSRALILGIGLLFVMMMARSAAETQEAEFMGSLLLLIVGLNLIAMSADLVLLFLGLELVSIPTYVLLFLGSGHVARGAAKRQEAATKYFFLSILSSAVLLYGLSFLYGATGSMLLGKIGEVSRSTGGETPSMIAKLALVLIFAGLCFRLTAVPFHFYAPDVYQGTSNPNAGLLSVAPKIAGLLVMVRVVMVAMPGLERMGWQLTLATAIVTMTLGNLLALWQNNMRRMLAYSSIAHAGYMLVGLSVGFATAGGGARELPTIDGVGATLFYLLVYALATAGTFSAITFLGGRGREIDTVDDLAGLNRSNPKVAMAIAIFMFSLTGLPPLAGFWGKFGLLLGAMGIDASSGLRGWFLTLSVIVVINAAISAAYYLRIIATMYFRPQTTKPEAEGGLGAAAAVFMCAVLVVGIGLDPGTWQEKARQVSHSVRAPQGHSGAHAAPHMGNFSQPGASATSLVK